MKRPTTIGLGGGWGEAQANPSSRQIPCAAGNFGAFRRLAPSVSRDLAAVEDFGRLAAK